MSGLVKAKKYDWKDSNLALFGSDTEKQVKKDSAETEKAWNGAGQKTGLQIWRIVKFKVTHLEKDDYGKFFNGDSYIILNTYNDEESDELLYDVHFWIGSNSTQDEYGTAAYKTVELDTLLDDKPVQHREVEGHESNLFKTYFPKYQIMEGGAASGFRHVTPEEYRKRLLHFHGDKKNITVKEVPCNKNVLKSSDVYILDLGLEIYLWIGAEANKDEKFKAIQFVQGLKSERSGRPKAETLDQGDIRDSHPFYDNLSNEDLEEDEQEEEGGKSLHRVSDASGSVEFEEVATGDDVSKDQLAPEDVFIFNSGKEIFVWVGSGASELESRNGISYAHNYSTQCNSLAPVTIVKEGDRAERQFEIAISA